MPTYHDMTKAVYKVVAQLLITINAASIRLASLLHKIASDEQTTPTDAETRRDSYCTDSRLLTTRIYYANSN